MANQLVVGPSRFKTWPTFLIPLLLLADISVFCPTIGANQLAVNQSFELNLPSDDNLNSSRGPLVCSSQLDALGCHPSGLDSLKLLKPQDSKCSLEPLPDRRLNLSSCPCKAHYTGPKCDTCAAGYYQRPITQASRLTIDSKQIQPEFNNRQLKRQDRLQSTNQRPTLTLGRRPIRHFTCEPCGCDPVGSKSHICERRNGTCFCQAGHSGPKCDTCSPGYYNGNNSLVNVSTGKCVECGSCFNQWHVSIISLRELSVETIKRSHELSESLTTNMAIQTIEPNKSITDSAAQPAETLGPDSFSQLDQKMGLIGDQVMANKQSSDQLTLLAGELEALTSLQEANRVELTNRQNISSQLYSRFSELARETYLQSILVADLQQRTLTPFKAQLLDALDEWPTGAIRQVNIQLARSKNITLKLVDELDNLSPNSEVTIKQLGQTLDNIRANHLELNKQADVILESTLDRFNLTLDRQIELLVGDAFNFRNEHFHLIVNCSQLARLLIEDLSPRLVKHLNESDSRMGEIQEAGRLLAQARSSIGQTDETLELFASKLGKLQEDSLLICGQQQQQQQHDNSDCDFGQLLENATESVRLSLDTLDAKGTLARSEIPKLDASISDNATRQLLDLIQSTDENLQNGNKSLIVQLVNFSNSVREDLENLVWSRDRSRALQYDLEPLKDKLVQLDSLRGQTEVKNKLISALGSELVSTIDVANQTVSQLEIWNSECRSSNSCNLGSDPLAPISSQMNRARNRLSSILVSSIERRAKLDLSFRNKREELTRLDTNNRNLLFELKSKLPLLTAGGTMEKNLTHVSLKESEVAGIERIQSNEHDESYQREFDRNTRLMSQHRRLVNLVSDYRNISGTITRLVVGTRGLADEFEVAERRVSQQEALLSQLHSELDRLLDDIRIQQASYSC